jgi:hypothetical protein
MSVLVVRALSCQVLSIYSGCVSAVHRQALSICHDPVSAVHLPLFMGRSCLSAVAEGRGMRL